ncbi:hypothetical protein BKA61DRAFT_709943 [Leptodontidium sp. MPI-SDFR-AT-0119]|nr:hypothetical protein BKA61DRAFT_709943 [Leptodontidium sp. MPI-SDFR-AT-0119]
MPWTRLIRFVSNSGITTFGDPCIEKGEDLLRLLDKKELYARRLEGNDPFELTSTNEKVRVERLLGILTPEDVPIIKCIGLNYVKHITELGRKPPPYPSMFMKPSPAISDFNSDIIVPSIAQHKNLDYEGELAVVIGKTGKNITSEKALSYIAGYASSNDVSERKWQRDPLYAGSVPQWSFGKSFDTFAPIGPMIVSPSILGAAGNLDLRTFVNGQLRQGTNTKDLLFGAVELVCFLSQGSTLQKGTVIMTGTPGGVVLGMEKPVWLGEGDVVEVSIEGLGSCVNRVVYER